MRAPSLAKASAVARPIPVRAPVIKTTGVFIANSLRGNYGSVEGDRLNMDVRIFRVKRFPSSLQACLESVRIGVGLAQERRTQSSASGVPQQTAQVSILNLVPFPARDGVGVRFLNLIAAPVLATITKRQCPKLPRKLRTSSK